MMREQPTPNLLDEVLEHFCTADAFDNETPGYIKRFLNHPDFPGRNEQFKQELANAILHHAITPEEYERLTDAAYDEQESVDGELYTLWQHLYGDEPVTLNCIQTGTTAS